MVCPCAISFWLGAIRFDFGAINFCPCVIIFWPDAIGFRLDAVSFCLLLNL